jgi:hypothetical protein
MGSQIALRTTRLSATGGTRDLASILVSHTGGAGSLWRLYKFTANQNKNNGVLSGRQFFFDYLGGNQSYVNDFYRMYNRR